MPTTELQRVETADGLILDGALQHPTSPGTLPVDAFLIIHGTGSNFYSPGVLETFAAHAVAAGTAVLRINTRGHDGMCSIPSRSGSVKGGATYELIQDCVHDVSAWLGWLEQNGFDSVVLVGHSMGGVKAVYSQAHAAHRTVQGVVGISPPRFSHERMLAHPKGALFRNDCEKARQFLGQGQPDQLLAVTQPLPFVATAAGYLEKYGPENRYDYVPLLSQIHCPALILLGSQSIETSPAFAGLDSAISDIEAAHSHVRSRVVPGANINYAGCMDVPYQLVAEWLPSINKAGFGGRESSGRVAAGGS
jgi:pimeloyl-ACP methyl ester carboxylesterase